MPTRFTVPAPLVKRIVPVQLFIRGTSTAFSKKGDRRKKVGLFETNMDREPLMTHQSVHAYRIPPIGKTHSSWTNHFEATVHAAIERALKHSQLVGTNGAFKLLTPTELPCIIVSWEPAVLPNQILSEAIHLGKPHDAYRPQYEWALVNGKARQTFPEGLLDPEDKPEILRIEFTKKEYERALKNAENAAQKAGYDLKNELLNFARTSISLGHNVDLLEIRQLKDPSPDKNSAYENALSEYDVHLKNAGWDLVQKTIGHEQPKPLAETGWHAHNAFTYLVGEHIKQIMAPKVYRAIEKIRAKAQQMHTRSRNNK